MSNPTNDLATQLRKQFGEEVELRTVQTRAAADESTERVVTGYASVFNQPTRIRDWAGEYNEVIAPGAFDAVLAKNPDVRFLINHDGVPLARTKNGTITLSVDDHGLRQESQLVDTQLGRDTYAMIKRGDIDQMSFAFTVEREEWNEGTQTRTILQVRDLYDIAAVTYPAYEGASIVARSKFPQGAPAPAPTEPTNDAPEITSDEVRNLPPKSITPKPTSMNLRELQAQRAKLVGEYEALVSATEAEGRSMSEAEQQRSDFLFSEVQRLDEKITHQERMDAMSARANGVGVSSPRAEAREVGRMNKRFSLAQAIKTRLADRPLEGLEAEFQQEARNEARDMKVELSGDISIPMKFLRAGAADNFQSTATGDGSGFVGVQVPGFIEGLQAPSVLESIGATIIDGAMENMKLPRTSVKPTLNTAVAEVTALAAAGMELDEVTLTAKKAGFYTKYSKQLLLQGGDGVANFILGELNRGLIADMDKTGLATFAAASITEVTSGDTALSATIANAMIKQVMSAGGDHTNGVYVMSPLAWQLSQAEARVASINALWDNGLFNDRRAIASPHLADGVLADTTTPAGEMLFGNFAQGTILAYFGGLDLEINRATYAKEGQVELVLSRWYDFAIRQAGAICKANALT
jgi:uncharacterized protein